MATDWEEKKAQSLQHADTTLAWIRDSNISATPPNYILGFEHFSGSREDVSKSLAELDAQGADLERQLLGLYQQFFASEDSQQLNEFRQALSDIMEQALSATAGTQADLSAYADQLKESSAQLDQQADDLSQVQTVISRLISETRRMDVTVAAMEQDLSSATGEINQLKRQYDEIREEVFADPLTGVLNRRGLDNRLAQLLRDSERDHQHSLLMIDLDNFKPLNDRYGHVVGDQVLCFIAKTLKNTVRGSDAVGRYGGDEFAIILPDTHPDDAVKVANNIVATLRKSQLKRRSTGELLGKITTSIGVAGNLLDDTPETLTDRADQALYRAKRAGKDAIASA